MNCPSCLAPLPLGYEGLCLECLMSGIEDTELEPVEEPFDPPVPPKTGPVRPLVPGMYPPRPYRTRRKNEKE